MNFKQHNELSDYEKSMLDIAQETALDHFVSLWNAVDKRLPELGDKPPTPDDLISLQLNAGAICAAHLLTHILTAVQGTTQEVILEVFTITVLNAVRTQLEAMKQEMH